MKCHMKSFIFKNDCLSRLESFRLRIKLERKCFLKHNNLVLKHVFFYFSHINLSLKKVQVILRSILSVTYYFIIWKTHEYDFIFPYFKQRPKHYCYNKRWLSKHMGTGLDFGAHMFFLLLSTIIFCIKMKFVKSFPRRFTSWTVFPNRSGTCEKGWWAHAPACSTLPRSHSSLALVYGLQSKDDRKEPDCSDSL